MIIACAEFLAESREFKHAAELLKASLRSGLTPERWYQEALAIALEESQGSAEDIERAYVSAIDLEPKNPETYLHVSRALNRLGDPDAANKKAEAEKVMAMIEAEKRRDLVVELAYAGPADLELRVFEPIGTQCSFQTPLSTAGGSLKRPVYDRQEDAYTETYLASQ